MPAQQRIAVLSLALLLTTLIAVHAHAAGVQLSWTAPTKDANGAPLTDLAGYHVYYGLASLSYGVSIDVGLTTSAAISGLVDGLTYYFAVTAYDQARNESAFSAEAARTLSAVDSDGDGLADVDEILIYGTLLPGPIVMATDWRMGRRWRCGARPGKTMGMAMASSTCSMRMPITMASRMGSSTVRGATPPIPSRCLPGGASRCLRMISNGPTPEWWAMVGWKSKAVLGPGSSMSGWSLTRPMMRPGH
jgi:hypothetical protein